jgi:hypothetical protein
VTVIFGRVPPVIFAAAQILTGIPLPPPVFSTNLVNVAAPVEIAIEETVTVALAMQITTRILPETVFPV